MSVDFGIFAGGFILLCIYALRQELRASDSHLPNSSGTEEKSYRLATGEKQLTSSSIQLAACFNFYSLQEGGTTEKS